MSERKVIRRALISVYDKTGLIELGSALHKSGVEILSTGSTAKTLAAANIPVIAVEDYTGFPEMMGGRVKTRILVSMVEFSPTKTMQSTFQRSQTMRLHPLI